MPDFPEPCACTWDAAFTTTFPGLEHAGLGAGFVVGLLHGGRDAGFGKGAGFGAGGLPQGGLVAGFGFGFGAGFGGAGLLHGLGTPIFGFRETCADAEAFTAILEFK